MGENEIKMTSEYPKLWIKDIPSGMRKEIWYMPYEDHILENIRGELRLREIRECDESKKYKPFLNLTYKDARMIFPLLLEAIIQDGCPLPDKSYIEGKTEAMKYHLEDLREMLKLKLK